jgi:hypothetical protein
VQVPVANLLNPAIAAEDGQCGKIKAMPGFVQVECVPFEGFSGGTGYHNFWGFQVENHNPVGPTTGRVSKSFFWDNSVGAFFAYTAFMTLDSIHILGDLGAPMNQGIHAPPEGFHQIVFQDLNLEGLSAGISFSRQDGPQSVVGGSYDNVNNFSVPTAMNATQDIRFQDPLVLGHLGDASHSDIATPAGHPLSIKYNGAALSIPKVQPGPQQLPPFSVFGQ